MKPKQKKIASEPEEYQPPLEVLLSFLRLPHKIYRDIYVSVIERRLSSTPLVYCDASIALLASQVGVEPVLMSEKIQNMLRMKWLEFEQVGNRDTNQIFVLSPVWRYKPDMDKDKFALALQKYHANIKEDTEHQMNTTEVYDLMNSCPHMHEKRDPALCELGRWPECEDCSHKPKTC